MSESHLYLLVENISSNVFDVIEDVSKLNKAPI